MGARKWPSFCHGEARAVAVCATDVFIIDHAVTFDRLDGARNALASYPLRSPENRVLCNGSFWRHGTPGTTDDVDGILLQLEPLIGCYRVGTRDAQTGKVRAQLVFSCLMRLAVTLGALAVPRTTTLTPPAGALTAATAWQCPGQSENGAC